MSRRTRFQTYTWKDRALSLLLAAVLLLGMAPGLTAPASAHWADAYLDQLVDWGVIRADQTGNPNAPITRADFAAIVNRAYGYTEVGDIPFTDVKVTDWFHDDIAIAYNAGYMAGTSATTASPNDTLTREMAVCILGRNMMMKETTGETLAFSDGRDISNWARGLVKTAVDNYIISGYPDNSFGPQDPISKGQMAVLVTQCLGQPIRESGSYSLGGVFGNVTITSPNVTLRDTTISGDLYVSGGVGLGGIKLENVNVLGRIIVSSSGESEAGEASVVMRNVTANEMLVDNMRNKTVTIRADGITDIAQTTVRTSAYLEDNNTDDKGLMKITLDGEPGTRLTLAGRIKEVENISPSSTIQVAKGSVKKLTVDEAAVGSTVQLDRNTEVKEMNLDVATSVTGEGDIEKLNVNAPGCVVSMLPDKIYIRPGLTANIAGVVMDHLAAEQGSTDPRLLSGYPAARDITPNGARADFSANKKGTIYWAVSSIGDGSIGEEDLISPPSYGSKAVSNGSVAAPTGDTVVSAQVTGLTVGGSYYLSAVLVDEQDRRSVVKVVSFSTPDNTVPAFAQGYPYMSYITDTEAQVAVMATKDCRMYYAVLPRNAQAPTADNLKSAAVSNNLGYGVVELEKNKEYSSRDQAFMVSRRLEELKDYTLYLWLTDGINSSAVIPVQFTTKDMTPPEFVVSPYEAGQPQANSVPLAATLNENGTIFWVVVEEGDNYPRPNNQDPTDNETDGLRAKLDSDYAKLQVANGMNCLQKGQVNAQANTEVKFNVTGLQPEKAYDLYYLAQDAAGNYSIRVEKIQGGIHTLDTSRPLVRQWFTSTSGLDETVDPMPDTDIVLEFSENVAYSGKDFLSLYENPDKSDFVNALHETITMFEQRIGSPKPNQVYDERNVESGEATEDQCVIDYTKARVEKATDGSGKVNLIFPAEGLRLSSGTTYYFEIMKITDNSTAKNEIRPQKVDFNQASITEGHKVPRFTVASARLNLTTSTLDEEEYPFDLEAQHGEKDIEFSFYVAPESTSRADEGVRYDLLFWSESRISFDLYYRKLDAKTMEPVTSGVTPELPAADTHTPMANGWYLLNNSGTPISPVQGETKGGVDLHKQFNNATSATFPRLKDLDDSGDYLYEFAVSVTQIGTVTNRKAWSGKVNFYVNAASAVSGRNLENLANRQTEENWRVFYAEKGMNGGGGSTIGVSTLDGSDTLKLDYDFSNTQVPSFTSGAPTFKVGDSSVEIGVNLTLPGTVYYLIAPVAPKESSTGISSIRTVVNKVPKLQANGDPMLDPDENVIFQIETKSDRDLYDSGVVPEVGGKGDPNIKDSTKDPYTESEWVTAPVVDDVRFPPYTNEQFKKGTYVYSGGGGYEPIKPIINGLLPNQEYFCYMVLVGANPRETSQVYLYTFKTSETSKPKFALSDTQRGIVQMAIANKVETDVKWRVFNRDEAESHSNLTEMIILPDGMTGYGTEITTLEGKVRRISVLDALETEYNASTAYGSSSAAEAAGKGSDYNGFSLFDVVADDTQRRNIQELVRNSYTSITNVKDNASTPTIITAEGVAPEYLSYVDYADWYTDSNGGQPDPSQYLFLIVGHNVDSESDEGRWDKADSFRALNGVSYKDGTPPKLIEVKSSITGTGAAGNETYSGYVILTFDKAVYWAENASSGGSRTIYSVQPQDDGKDDTIKTIGILNGYLPGNLTVFESNGTAGTTPSNIFSFSYSGLTDTNITLLPNGNICNFIGSSAPNGQYITIEISNGKHSTGVIEALNSPYVRVKFNGDSFLNGVKEAN